MQTEHLRTPAALEPSPPGLRGLRSWTAAVTDTTGFKFSGSRDIVTPQGQTRFFPQAGLMSWAV